MIRQKKIICISSIDWDFVWQGHQEIMDTFVRNGNTVLFVENTGIRVPSIADLPRLKKRLTNWFRSFKGIRKEKENLFIYSPVILPFPYSKIASFINRLVMLPVIKKWMKVTGFINPIIWTFLPTRTARDLISHIEHELSIYYCIADFDQLVSDSKKLRRSEEKLLKMVDLVFAQGTVLKNRCLKYNKNVRIFPFGVREAIFRKKEEKEERNRPRDIEAIKGIKVGYVGGLHKHIDYGLLEFIARRKPEWTIILIGPDQVRYKEKKKPKNIILVGMRKYEELPDYIANMDICLIPYEINEYTKTVYPTKLNEYLLMGKPVVSIALPEIEEFTREHGDVVFKANTKEEFLKKAEHALKSNSSRDIERRKEVAMTNTWENRVEEMSHSIEETEAEKSKASVRSWQEDFIELYRTSWKKTAKIVAAVALLYFLVFYSPLLWILAEPLKISEVPKKADAIIVFGGGVGETGSPGKSTIERARYSVELFKKGYAKKIVYSSGYSFKYTDASNMKLFALSMDVPEENIILEQKANSCYENVKYTYEIMKQKDLNRVILISSPYNMRRASLVFRTIADDTDVVYCPVLESEFYTRHKRVEISQIRAILHEYLGILYYIVKGYINI